MEDGYANAYRKYKISKLDEFIKCENEARENRRGLWGDINGLRSLDKPEVDKNELRSGKDKRDKKNSGIKK